MDGHGARRHYWGGRMSWTGVTLQGKQRDLRLEKDGTSGFCMSRDGTSHLTEIELSRGLSRNGTEQGDGRYGLGIYTSRLKKLRWKTFSFSIICGPWGLPLCRINIDDMFVAYNTDMLSGVCSWVTVSCSGGDGGHPGALPHSSQLSP